VRQMERHKSLRGPVDTFVATLRRPAAHESAGQGDPSLPPRTLTAFAPSIFSRRGVRAAEDLRTFRFAVPTGGVPRSIATCTAGRRGGTPAVEATIIAKLPATIAIRHPEGETTSSAVPRRALRYFDPDTG